MPNVRASTSNCTQKLIIRIVRDNTILKQCHSKQWALEMTCDIVYNTFLKLYSLSRMRWTTNLLSSIFTSPSSCLLTYLGSFHHTIVHWLQIFPLKIWKQCWFFELLIKFPSIFLINSNFQESVEILVWRRKEKKHSSIDMKVWKNSLISIQKYYDHHQSNFK